MPLDELLMKILLNLRSIDDYRTFLKIKRLPQYSFTGRMAEFPDEYAERLGLERGTETAIRYSPIRGLFDYQRDIAALALRKKKFAVFADCGLGKTLIFLEYIRHVIKVLPRDKRILVVSPLMVIPQTLAEMVKFYSKVIPMIQVKASGLTEWITEKSVKGYRIGITNYEAITDETPQGQLGALILDESSMLKSHYGKWASNCVRLGRGLEWKLTGTGTPAPNDRIEYANHAVFLDAFPTVNSFLAKFFLNRGQTDNRWELKPHAIVPFYRALSHWCIFLTNPATYGWKDNCQTIPPIETYIHEIDLTQAQRTAVYDQTNRLFVDQVGGITSRAALARIGKGSHNGNEIEAAKPLFIKRLAESWDKSTIIWCKYNDEQARLERLIPEAASICGATPYEERKRLLDDFKAGRIRIMLSKPKVLGFGLNLQICTRMIFSAFEDSYELYYQAVKRANRIGSTESLQVHIPITEIERPQAENILRKAGMVQRDTEEQERVFKEYGFSGN
jgi:superfamily II DNA or RNA helicase